MAVTAKFVDSRLQFKQNILPEIRNTARAVIIRGQQILLLKKNNGELGDRFVLPGGAQEPGETLEQAIIRECVEEIAAEVHIDGLLHIAEYFKQKHTPELSIRHQMEFLFACSVPETYTPKNGPNPDKYQVDVVWVDLPKLASLPTNPIFMAKFLADFYQREKKVYLGEIN